MKSVIKIHTRDRWSWLYIPTLILSSTFLLNLIISHLLNDGVDMYTGGLASAFIYIFILGILVVVQTFPFALGMSIRRKDYFIGTSLMGLLSSVALGLLVFICATIEHNTGGWGSGMHFFHFPYLNDGTVVEQIVMYILICILLFFFGFIISSFSRRFGGKGLLISALFSVLGISVTLVLLNYYDAWINIFNWFAKHTAVELTYWLIPFIIIFSLGSFFFLRRATVQ